MVKLPGFILVAANTLLASVSFGCLNEYNRKEPPMKGGQLELKYLLKQSDGYKPYWSYGFYDLSADSAAASQYKKDISKLNWRELSDYAVNELRVGDRSKALTILEELYRSHPNEYNIIANLGTAYELNGNNAKALELLKQAVNINPLSHYGSEWIHIRILEQELAAKPDYREIINLKTGNFQEWLLDKNYRFPRPADSLKMQIAFQLHERIGFIAPPNKTIGQLVTDFADIVAKTDSLGAAKEFYEFALRYDSTLRDTIAVRIKGVESSQKEVKDTFRWATVVWAIPLLALVLIFLAWLKSLRNQKRTEQ